MACKKSELMSVINSYTNARLSGDANLINFSANLLSQVIESLEFNPEEEQPDQKEVTEE